MLLTLLGFCILVTIAAAIFKDLLPHLIQYGFFLRFPILVAILLMLLPFAQSSYIPDLFEFEDYELVEVTALALLAAWSCLLTGEVVVDAARHRFGVARVHPPYWLQGHRLALASLLAFPLLFRISLTASSWADQAQIAGGIACAFGALWIISVARQLFVPPDSGPPLLVSERWIPKAVLRARPLGFLSRLLPPARLRKFPRVLGAGYIDYGGGTIHPGPIWLLVLLAMVALACSYSNASIDWRIARHQPVKFLPPLAYLEISLILLALLLSQLSFFLDRYRISVAMVVVLWIVIPYWTHSAGHYFLIHQSNCRNPGSNLHPDAVCSGPPALTAAISPWLAKVGANPSRKPVLVVVCASGGGTQASAWTVRVLSGLQQEMGPDFIRSIRMFSGVSGGSLGLFYYLASYDPALGAPEPEQLPFIRRAAESSTGDSLARGLVENDLLRKLAPFGSSTHDRGWELERTWANALLRRGHPQTFSGRLSDWRAGVSDGWMPAAIFNATLVETGGPMLFTTVDVPRSDGVIFGKSHSAYEGADINILTAVRLSASFAWVSPAAVARYDNTHGTPRPVFHVVDGAYYDNFGVDAAVDWCWDLLHAYRDRIGKIVVVQIRARPVERSYPSEVGYFIQTLAPFYAATNVMSVTQLDRDEAELERLMLESDGLVDTVEFTAPHGISASWSLPVRAREWLEKDWQAVLHGDQMRKLRELVNGGETVAKSDHPLTATTAIHHKSRIARARAGDHGPAANH